jgi:hypothetical protein
MKLYITSTIANNRVSYLDLDIDATIALQDQILVYRKFSLDTVYALNNTPSSDLVQIAPSIDEIRTLYSLPNASSSGSAMYTLDEATHNIVFSTDPTKFLWQGGGVHHSRLQAGIAYDIQLPVAATGDTVQIFKKPVISESHIVFSSSDRLKSTDLESFTIQLTSLMETSLLERKTPELNIRIGNPMGITPLDSDKTVPLDNLREDVMTGLRSTATITFTGTQTLDKTIILISTDDTTKTYTAKNSNSFADGEFKRDSSTVLQATYLKSCIDHANNHNDKIIVTQESGASVLTLTQRVGGSSGNTVTTSTLDNCTVVQFASNPAHSISAIKLEDFGNVDYKTFAIGDLDGYEFHWDGSASWTPIYPLFSVLNISNASELSTKNNWIVYYNGSSLDLKNPLFNILEDVTVTNSGGAEGPVIGQLLFADSTTTWNLTKKADINALDVLEWDNTDNIWFLSDRLSSTIARIPGFLYDGTSVPFPGAADDDGNPIDGGYWGEPHGGTATVLHDFGDVNTIVNPKAAQLLVWDTSLTNTVDDDYWEHTTSSGAWINRYINLYDMNSPGSTDRPDYAFTIANYTKHGITNGDMPIYTIVDASADPVEVKLEHIGPFDWLASRYSSFTNTQAALEDDQILVFTGDNNIENKRIGLNDLGNVQTVHTDGVTLPAEGAQLEYVDEGDYGMWKPTSWTTGAVDTAADLRITREINQNVSDLNWGQTYDNYGSQLHIAPPFYVRRAMKITGMRMISMCDPSPSVGTSMHWGMSGGTGSESWGFHLCTFNGWTKSNSFFNSLPGPRVQGWKVYKQSGAAWDANGDPSNSPEKVLLSVNASELYQGPAGGGGSTNYNGIINMADLYTGWGGGGPAEGSLYDFATYSTWHPILGGDTNYFPLGASQVVLAAGDILFFEYVQTSALAEAMLPTFGFPKEMDRIQQTIILQCEDI